MRPEPEPLLTPEQYEAERLHRLAEVEAALPANAWTMDDPQQRRRKKRARWGRPIVCRQTGQRFVSVAAVVAKLGIGYSSMYRALETGGTAGGMHWRYEDVPEGEQPRPKVGWGRQVRIGSQTYLSVFAAAKALRLTAGQVYQALYRGHLSRRVIVRETVEWVGEVAPNAKYDGKLRKKRSGKSRQSGGPDLRANDRDQPDDLRQRGGSDAGHDAGAHGPHRPAR